MKIAVIAIIVGTFTLCSSFEILLDGEATTRARFCIGDRITLVCNGNTMSYAWQIPSVGIEQADLTVTPGNALRDTQGITAEYVSQTVTMLNFTAREDINGSDILCVDFINDIVLTSKVFSLHNVPDTPPIVYTSTNADLSSFGIRISSNSSDEATVCVNHYNISITGDDGQSQFAVVPRDESATYNSNTVFRTVFNLYTTMYTLTVVASIGGSAIMMDIISFQGFLFDECPSDLAKELTMEAVITYLSSEFSVSLVGLTRSQAASSCEEILHAHPSGQGFQYWISDGNVSKQQYC